MAKPTTGEMLRHANEITAANNANFVTAEKRQVNPSVMPEPLTVDSLIDDEEDPFGGNINNRRVAKRIANEKKRVYLNHSQPTHLGDPDKARKDIAKSEALNPDDEAPLTEAPVVVPPMPLTPGSPAAKKAAKAAEDEAAKKAASEGQAATPPWEAAKS